MKDKNWGEKHWSCAMKFFHFHKYWDLGDVPLGSEELRLYGVNT